MHYSLRFCTAPVFVVALSSASALMGMDTSLEGIKNGGKKEIEDPTKAATALLVGAEGVEFRLSKAETNYLAGLISTRPKEAHLTVTHVCSVFVNGVKYTLLPDELILADRGEGKIWESPGESSHFEGSWDQVGRTHAL